MMVLVEPWQSKNTKICIELTFPLTHHHYGENGGVVTTPRIASKAAVFCRLPTDR